MAEMENLSIALTADASEAVKIIKSLTQELGGLKKVLKETSSNAKDTANSVSKIGDKGNGTTEVEKSARKVNRELKEIQKTAREPIKWFPDKESIKETARSVKAVGEAFKEMASAATGAVGGLIKQMVKLSGSIAKASFKTLLNGAKLAAKGLMSFTSHVLKLVGALGRLAVSAAGAALSKLGGWAKSAAGGIASIVKQGTFLPLMFGKNLVQGIGGAIKGVGNLLKQFKRVVMYRALRSVIKEITQGFQEGLKNLYAWSRGVGGEFAQSMNRIATASQYLKNSLGALASPLIESLAPAIDFVIDKFVALINIVNQFLARLGGKSTYIAAKKAAAQWDNAASHAGSAANAMKRYTLAFDELNILGKSSGGSGGGGGGSSSGAGGMFEERPIEGEVSSFADDIMAAFNTQDWARIGELLAGKFNEIIDSIPWPDIGDKIANGVNMAMGVAHSFLVETDFEGLGKDISDLFNHAVSNIDWDLMGRTAGEKFGAVLRTLTSLWEGIDFSVLGQRLSEAFNGYVDTVTTRISEIDWQWLGQKFSYGLNNLIGGIDWAALGDMLIAGFSSTIDLLLSAVETFDWVKAGEAVATFINKLWDYDWPGLVTRAKEALKGVLEGLKTAAKGFSWGDAKDTFYSMVGALFDADKFNTEPGGLGELLGGGINTAIEGMKGALGLFSWGDAATKFATEVNGLISKVKWYDLGVTMRNLLHAAVTMLKNTSFEFDWGNAGTRLVEAINGFFDDPQIWFDVGTTFNNLLNGALDFTIKFVENFDVEGFTRSVKVALAAVHWDQIASKVWELFAKAAIKLGNLITVFFGGEIKDQKPIENSATSVQEAINEKFAVRNHQSLTSGDATVSNIATALSSAITQSYSFLKDTLDRLPWEDWGNRIGAAIHDFMGSTEWVDIGQRIGAAIVSGFRGVGKLGKGLVEGALGPEITEGVKNFVKNLLGEGGVKTVKTLDQYFNEGLDIFTSPEMAQGIKKFISEGSSALGRLLSGNVPESKMPHEGNPGFELTNYEKGLVPSMYLGRPQAALDYTTQGKIALYSLDAPEGFNPDTTTSTWFSDKRNKQQQRDKYNAQYVYYSLLGGYYDVRDIVEGGARRVGSKVSNALEEARTEKALLNQAQFLVATGKTVKEVAKELGLNTKQQKKLTDAMSISPAAAALGLDNMSTQEMTTYTWYQNQGIFGGLNSGSMKKAQAVVDILLQPEGNLQTKYQNQGLIDWLKKIFEPGVDTETRVELIKNGWKTLPEFVGTNKVLTAYTELVKKITGQTPATLFTNTLAVLSWLTKKNNGETTGSFFGPVLSVISWLTKKNSGETTGTFFGDAMEVVSWLKKKYDKQTPATVFGSNLDITGNLKPGSTQPKDLYASAIDVLVRLKKDTNNKLKFDVVSGGGTTINTLMVKKLGGAYHNGAWHDIPQYANGTVNAHGSLFLAGEAGPEIVGHVGGRTEVLNKSQLASAMFASVRAAMSPAVEMFRGLGNSFAAAADRAMNAAIGMADALYTQTTGSYSGGYSASEAQSQDMDALLSLMRQESEATRQQNELLRQQNELLRQISEKDYSPSTAQLSRAFNRTNMRAGTTVIPVGT